MNYIKKSVLTLLMMMSVLLVNAQDAVQAVLTDAAITKFVKTYIPMSRELEELGHEFDEDEDSGEEFDMEALLALEGVTDILTKYGWDEQMFSQITAISMGYAFLKMEDEAAKMNEQEKAFYNLLSAQFKMMVHEKDLTLIKPRMAELTAVFEELEKNEDY